MWDVRFGIEHKAWSKARWGFKRGSRNAERGILFCANGQQAKQAKLANRLNSKMLGGWGRLRLVFQMTFVAELPLGFAELRRHIPAVVTVHHIIATCTAIARLGVRVGNKCGFKIPPADILKWRGVSPVTGKTHGVGIPKSWA